MARSAIGSNLFQGLLNNLRRHREIASHASQNQSQSNNRRRLSDEELLEKVKSESYRLITFNDAWEEHCPGVPASKMARAGFFYVNEADKAQCAFCLGVIYGFRPGDNPKEIHMRVFEHCPFVLEKEVGNVPIPEPSDLRALKDCEEAVAKAIVDLGLVEKKKPSFPDMQTYGARLKTFKKDVAKWPKKNCPKKLAKAGFFYSGTDDTVLCYQCEYNVSKWAHKEDPWIAHARTNQHCSYVSFMKGPMFASSIFEKLGKREPKDSPPAVSLDPDSGFSDGSSAEDNGESNEEAGDYDHLEDAVGLLGHSGPYTKVTSRKMGLKGSENVAKSFECQVCMDRSATVVMLPCRHLCSCKTCAVQVAQCPLCRTDIKATVECFLP